MNLTESFSKLMGQTFIRYSGCLIERSGSGFIWCRKYYSSWEGVTGAIDQAFKNLKNTIAI